MSTTIKYKDRYGNFITQQQSLQLKNYIKEHYENDIIKSYEYISENSNLSTKGYYLESGEDVEDYINQYVTSADEGWVFYYNKETNTFGHIAYDKVIYRSGNIITRAKECYDNQGRVLAFINVNKETLELELGRKYYYNDDYTDDLPPFTNHALKFNFNGNNFSGVEVNILDGDPDEGYSIEEFTQLTEVMAVFPWDTNTYYHNILPILPDHSIN